MANPGMANPGNAKPCTPKPASTDLRRGMDPDIGSSSMLSQGVVAPCS